MWWLLALLACSGSDKNPDNTGTTGTATDDTGGGGGSGDNWLPSGTGYGWFVDGQEDNSVFHLEMAQTQAPKDGEAYYGWISKGGADPVGLGEIVVTGEDVLFEGEIGTDAILHGYDTFEAYATANGGSAPDGTLLWVGAVDPTIAAIVHDLLIESTRTPDGLGSLRSLQAYIAQLQEAVADAVAEQDIVSLHVKAEKIANAIDGTADDVDNNGTVEQFPWQIGVVGENGYVNLIFSDLDSASAQVTPPNPIKDFAKGAYDCTQLVESHAKNASKPARTATAAGALASGQAQLQQVATELTYAVDGVEGEDTDTVIDPVTEGTLTCAIYYVAEMARMSVTTR